MSWYIIPLEMKCQFLANVCVNMKDISLYFLPLFFFLLLDLVPVKSTVKGLFALMINQCDFNILFLTVFVNSYNNSVS